MSEQYQIGQTVEWSSQANGTRKQKRGVVVAVVPRDRTPRTVIPTSPAIPQSYKLILDTRSGSRNHESYIVAVPSKSGRGKVQLYWPRTSALRKVESE